jgi:hypothetical protein
MRVLTMLARSSKAGWQITAAIALAALLAALVAAIPLVNHGGAGRFGAQDATAGERAAERRALEVRRTELAAHATMPGSPLPCLDALAGESVESACEQAVFASPSSLAAAVSYAAARLRLLADGVAYARRLDPSYEANVADLRIAVENDAYGIYAHVLTRDGCTAERCAAFDLLRDTTTLKMHLRQRVYATYVAQYTDRWGLARRPSAAALTAALPEPPAVTTVPTATTAEAPVSTPGWTATIAPPPMPRARPTPAMAARTETEAAPAPPPTAEVTPVDSTVPAARVRGVVPPAASILPNIEFPSANSIPPVSIMAAEPKLPPAETAPAAPSSTAPKGSPRAQ